ncbi:MAG: M28 family peptidase [Gemmatimonadetes bacterium]|nr:M28 family peptidase [Gemmatimonadota bacterium]MDE2676986.1 M28 family peptidase [Gemmatimonadota bacterium]MXX34183.1 M28 family peptidase [Gemmatimonadota bacterium]MYD15516.1 M28 family peptidase [Gemmatimonadota bacterium]MYI65410.1 M28 family peptidase [Gemmatimonadota bacterium]
MSGSGPIRPRLAAAWRALAVPVAAGLWAGVTLPAAGLAQQSPWRCPEPASLTGELTGELAHVRYLADDLLEGRAVATRGERCAGDYIAARFAAIGLQPAAENGGWFQSWTVSSDNPHGGAVHGEARNVVAILPGSAPHRTQSLVIGAHYDHLGLGGFGSLSPDATGTVHNGADDNASGTAVLIEAARALASGPPLAQDVLFIAFTGEERGLWGSAHYVNAPLLPLEGTVAMLNLDMVGRVRDGLLTVMGTGTAEEWEVILERANASIAAPLDLRFNSDGFGASDHTSFYARGIPVLHFFSNTHPDYHRVEDDWELVNAEGMDRVTDLVAAVVREVVPAAGMASLTPVEGAGNPHGVSASGDASSMASGFRVRLGTIPDYSRESGGMAITAVREGGPAAEAGLQGGDIIVKFGPHEIDTVYDYMAALNEYDPGDEVEIVVLRGEERLSFTAVLVAGG